VKLNKNNPLKTAPKIHCLIFPVLKLLLFENEITLRKFVTKLSKSKTIAGMHKLLRPFQPRVRRWWLGARRRYWLWLQA